MVLRMERARKEDQQGLGQAQRTQRICACQQMMMQGSGVSVPFQVSLLCLNLGLSKSTKSLVLDDSQQCI